MLAALVLVIRELRTTMLRACFTTEQINLQLKEVMPDMNNQRAELLTQLSEFLNEPSAPSHARN